MTLKDVDTIEALEALKVEEEAGAKRKGAFTAIDDRIEEIKASQKDINVNGAETVTGGSSNEEEE